MPGLFLEKPSQSQKTKDHLNTLERHLSRNREIFLNFQTKAEPYKKDYHLYLNEHQKIFPYFKQLMQKGNVSDVLRVLISNE